MPSRESSNRPTLRAVVGLAVLIVLAASLPAAAVAGPAPSDGATATASGIADNRATCPHDSALTDSVTSPANASPPSTPNESADLAVARGDVAVVPLSVPAGANATVSVGSGDGYTARLAVQDDGDGQVRLLVNTYLAGNRTAVASGTYRTAGDDTVTVTGGTPTAPLEPGTYPLTARQNGTVVAERQLTVAEPSFESVTSSRAVPRLFDADDAVEIRAANRSGLIRPLRPGEYGPEVVSGETVLLRIDAPSLLGAVAAQSGNTTTEQFLALHEETEPTTPETFSIMGPCGGIQFHDTVAEGGASVHLDYREGAVYVLLDTENLEGIDAGGQSVYVEASPESRINEMDEEAELTTEFRIGERRITVGPTETDVVALSSDGQSTITGETNLLPGSRVPIRVESRTDPTFERRTTATVAENGTFTESLDLENASSPELFTLHVGPERFPAEVGDPPSVHWELHQFRVTEPVRELSVERLDLPNDGFLVAYQYDRAAERFRPVGSATASDEDLAVEPLIDPQHLLVVAHRDANENGAFDGPSADPPYRVDSRVVHDWVSVGVDGVTPPTNEPSATFDADRVETLSSETRTTTDTTTFDTATPDSATSTTPTASDSTTPSDATGTELPGFGPLVALLAFVVVITLVATVASFQGRRR